MRMVRILSSCIFLLYCTMGWTTDFCIDVKTRSDMVNCTASAYQATDIELNVTYGKIIRILHETAQETLKGAQRLWIPFRDANCEHYAINTNNQSLYYIVKNRCLESMTRNRIRELQMMYPQLFIQ